MTPDEVRATALDRLAQIQSGAEGGLIALEEIRHLPVHPAIRTAFLRLDADLRAVVRQAKNLRPFLDDDPRPAA